MNNSGTNAIITPKEAKQRAPYEKADSVKAVPPELNLELTKPGEKEAATREPPSADQMVLDLKQKIAEAKENKPADITTKGRSNRPLFLLCLRCHIVQVQSRMNTNRRRSTHQVQVRLWTKNRATTGSTLSPDQNKKKQSPLSASADESLLHSGRNFDALVRMDSLSKAAFHWTLLRHPEYTQAYLDHAYNIVHDFRKCDICVLHEINPKEGGAI
jgi:hypothetical protein